MGPLFFLLGTFLVCWGVIAGVLWSVCQIKAKYTGAEHWFWKHVIELLAYYECTECKKACENHWKLIGRSALFALVLSVVFFAGYCVR